MPSEKDNVAAGEGREGREVVKIHVTIHTAFNVRMKVDDFYKTQNRVNIHTLYVYTPYYKSYYKTCIYT